MRFNTHIKQGTIHNLLNTFKQETKDILSLTGALDKMQKASEGIRPLMLIVETINVCNSECIFCPYIKQTRPKGLMKEEIFSRVIEEYLKIGGGPVSLTPMVGDVLLDKKLGSRMKILRHHAEKITASITTNLFALGNWPDDKVAEMLETFQRIHVSCYGITAQENKMTTQKGLFETFRTQMSRLP